MRSPLLRAGAAALPVAAALAVAWYVPALSVIAVWPLFLVVPGWMALGLLAPRTGLAGRLGMAILVSVAVSTHLVHWLSVLAGGYGRGTVFAAAAILALTIPIAAWRGWRSVALRMRAALPELALAGMASAFVGLVLAAGLWEVRPDGVYAGGSNWSDLGVHLSIAETLNAGANFPPEVPYFAGEPLVYHWFADFHAAVLALAAGTFSIPAMLVQSTVMAGALVLLVAALARHLVRGRGARRIGLLAATLVVVGGGLGWIRFVGDLTAGLAGPLELIEAHSYDNQWLTDWPYFRIPSVLGTGLLAHRATTVGLPLLVAAILLLVLALPTARASARGRRDRPMLLGLAGLMGALLAPFHFFFFPVVPLLAWLWVTVGDRLLERAAARHATWFLAPYALAAPFVLAPLVQSAGSGSLRVVQGWGSAPLADGLVAVAFFYLTNLGLPLVLALVALLVPRAPQRAFLGLWVATLFVVPNVVQVSSVDFDMNKYFQAMWIAVAILAAWLVHRWPWPAIAAVLLVSVPSPLLVAGWTATSSYQVMTDEEYAAARWIAAETPADSVFVTDGFVNSLTDAAGRKRLTTFAPYVGNLGYDPNHRILQVHAIYCDGDPAVSAALMRELGADHVIDRSRPAECTTPTDFASGHDFELAHENPGLRIWRLVGEPVSSAP